MQHHTYTTQHGGGWAEIVRRDDGKVKIWYSDLARLWTAEARGKGQHGLDLIAKFSTLAEAKAWACEVTCPTPR